MWSPLYFRGNCPCSAQCYNLRRYNVENREAVKKDKRHMRVQDHLKLSAAAAMLALPWVKKDIWIPFAASIFIDVDHYLWHAVTHRTLSLAAAVRFFGQA